MYSARSELLRLIMASGRVHVDEDKLRQLVQRRDAITWTINALIDGELLASVADMDKVCERVVATTKQLRALTDIANDIDKAISYGKDVLDAATSALKAVRA
jgi:hypothetical protein